jgi:hypothetical protein
VPSLGGALAAMLLGWVVDDAVQPFLGQGVTLALSFVGSTIVFFWVRNWLKQLRDG